MIATAPVGKIVKLTVVREGQEKDLAVTVGLYREAPARQERPPRPTP
jgi:S1-C subfamily serine protease